jgi:predicted AAA+ superfamily ATPase
MFHRLAAAKIADHLSWSPAVGILGPRQVGKTTLCWTGRNPDDQI